MIKKLKAFVCSKQEKIKVATIAIMSVLVLTKLLGFIKLRLIAANFGVSANLDLFYAANTIPDAVFTIFVAGTFASAVVPLFSRQYNKGFPNLVKSFRNLSGAFGLFFFLVGLILFFFGEGIASFYLQYANPMVVYDMALMVKIIRVLSFTPMILCISTLVNGYLQVQKRFIISSLAMPMHTLGVILGTLLLKDIFIQPILGLAWGTVLGTILHLGVQLLGVNIKAIFKGFSFIKIKQDLSYLFNQSIPRVMGLVAEYITRIHATALGLNMVKGAVSAYQYAKQLYLMPSSILGYALGQALFPELSKCKYKEEKAQFIKLVRKAFNVILLVTLPMALLVILLRFRIVRIFLSTGEFDMQSVYMTSWIFALLAIGIIFQTLLSVILKVYYAQDNTLTPFWGAIIGAMSIISGNVLFSNFFSNFWGTENFIASFNISSLQAFLNSLVNKADWFLAAGESPAAIAGLGLSISIGVGLEVVYLIYKMKYSRQILSSSFIKAQVIRVLVCILGGILFIFVEKLGLQIFDITRTLQTFLLLTFETMIIGGFYLLALRILGDSLVKYIEHKSREIIYTWYQKVF